MYVGGAVMMIGVVGVVGAVVGLNKNSDVHTYVSRVGCVGCVCVWYNFVFCLRSCEFLRMWMCA